MPFIDELASLPSEILLASYERMLNEHRLLLSEKNLENAALMADHEERKKNLALIRTEITRRMSFYAVDPVIDPQVVQIGES